MDKPKILTLNLKSEAVESLKSHKFNLYEGSLGKIVQTNNGRGEHKYCLLNFDFPDNLHEYDIIVVDAQFTESIKYDHEEHSRKKNKSENNIYLLSKYPQTIFDPRPHAAHILIEEIREIMRHDSMIIVMQGSVETMKYCVARENGIYPDIKGYNEYHIYNFLPFNHFSSNKSGTETKVVTKPGELTNFLNKYNSQFTYLNTFRHPTVWDDDERINDPNFIPLVVNRDEEIVSHAFFYEKTGIYMFPCLDDYSSFIVDFLERIAPSIQPAIFPESTKGSWRDSPDYFLPNHKNLLEQKKLLIEEYESKIKAKDVEIHQNKEKFGFLHQMLLETGDDLVSATIKFLEWLGFENVLDMDDEDPETLEEDIQIATEKGLLVIEVKGIGGTSKDDECGQISKIRYRRAEERGSFDVFGLYIVNHQRHLPPNDRENPPFTANQIRDAINDKRGLLTTYQLFKLYFSIQKGLISKEEAREAIYSYGLVEFKPANLQFIDTIAEIFLEGSVFIINLNDVEIKIGDKLYVEKNGIFEIIEIKGLQVDDTDVQSANSGEVGVKSSSKVKKKSLVYIKNMS